MAFDDCRGLPVTAASAEAVIRFDGFVDAYVSHAARTPRALNEAFDADPDLLLGHCAQGLCALLLARRELQGLAESALAKARASAAARGAMPRERMYVDALASMLSGSWTAAADILDGIVAAHPHDLFAVKSSHAVRFILGDAGSMRRTLLQAMPHWSAQVPGYGFVLGCSAFAHEETQDYAAAERLGRMALDHERHDAWGLHAVAHVYEMQGRWRDGMGWLEPRSDCWSLCNNFAFHVWWHYALFALESGDTDSVLDLYDRRIRAESTDDYRDVANASSLLARLDMAGVNVGDRWDELADIAERRLSDRCLVFADLHYLLALIGAGRLDAAWRLADGLENVSRGATQSVVASCVGAPIARALLMKADGDYEAAAVTFARTMPALTAIGGSHAQRDVFEQLFLSSAVESGQRNLAQGWLKRRLDQRSTERFAGRLLDRLETVSASRSSANGFTDRLPIAV